MSGAQHDDQAPPVRPGQRIRQFEIVSEIGRGGMGIVFHARDTELGRDVALKCPWPRFAADPTYRQRFLREARLCSRLSHPNIVPLFAVFEHEGLPWQASLLVEGKSLRDLLEQQGRLGMEAVLRLGEELSSALACAHEARIVHRDVTPRNILIGPDGRTLLTDFGLARLLAGKDADASTQTTTVSSRGAVVGTPHYMSPEQLLAKPVDGRSDIFALGAVLYEMCTGRPAFDAEGGGEIVAAILNREPEPISKFTYEVPAELERIIRKCLAKRPEERYQSAAELRVDLRALRHARDVSESSGRVAVARRAPWWLRWIVLGGSAVALLLIGVTMARRSLEARAVPAGRPFQVTASEEWEGDPAVSPDGSRIAYTCTKDGNADVYVVDIRGGHPLRLTDHPAEDRSPAWLPDGSALLFVSDRSGESAVWKVGPFGGVAALLLPDADHPAVSAPGPAGAARLAFTRTGKGGHLRVGVATLENPDAVQLITAAVEPGSSHWQPAWSPNGAQISFTTLEKLWVIPARGGEARALVVGGTNFHPSWSSDGRYIYFSAYREGTDALWRVASRGGAVERVTLGTASETNPDISRDGRYLAYAAELSTHQIVVLDVDSGQSSTLPGLRDSWMPAIDPLGRCVVYASNRVGERYDLWVQDLESGHPAGLPRRLTDHAGDASHPAMSPDSRWVAYYRILDGQRDLWMVATAGGPPERVSDSVASDLHPAWSPDGAHLAFASQQAGRSHIWVLPVHAAHATGPARQISQGEVSDIAPAWAPDGSSIAFVRFEGREREVWVASASGEPAPRKVTTGSGARRVRWEPATGALLVSGAWGADAVTLKRVDLRGEVREFTPRIVFGRVTEYATFDLTPDGKLLAYAREELKGDIWVLQADPGSY